MKLFRVRAHTAKQKNNLGLRGGGAALSSFHLLAVDPCGAPHFDCVQVLEESSTVTALVC
jgi:hypothetical protein